MTNHDNDTVRVGPEAFPGTIVARHNGYTLRRETRDDGTVNWRATRPASGHRIDYRRGTADVFHVDPEWRDVYGNADTESYAHTMLAAVEAATVFAAIVRATTVFDAIVRATTDGVFLPNVAADDIITRDTAAAMIAKADAAATRHWEALGYASLSDYLADHLTNHNPKDNQ